MTIRTMLLPFALVPILAHASPHDIIVGIDEKAVWGAEGVPVNGGPGRDAVLVMDVTNSQHPTIRASLPLENSVFGPAPPTCRSPRTGAWHWWRTP